MNVIFLDFDGVLNTIHYSSIEDVEKRIKILADICKECDCKVVIEASAKDTIDEVTMTTENEWVSQIFELFGKYGIECIGRTPNVEKQLSDTTVLSMWKEDEIRLYLFRHPEIEHYCVIDDDDTKTMLHWDESDLDKVREHLLQTIYYSENPDEEGLLESHKDKIIEILKKDNEIQKLSLRNAKHKRKR